MKAACLALAVLGALTGCATKWSADMPPVTYSGIVRNVPRGTPEPNARLVATRPALHLNIFTFWPYLDGVGDQEIGKTRSSHDGHFTLTTMGGYATSIWAVSQDHWLAGGIEKDLKHARQGLVIEMNPHLDDFMFSVALTDAEVTVLESAFTKIATHYFATHFRETLSIDAYRSRGILSADEFALLEKEKAYVCGPKPRIRGGFPTVTLRIDSFSQPVRFVPHAPTKSIIDIEFPPKKKQP